MLKIIVVEDEEIIRKGLVYTVDWLAMGCTVVGDAPNGKAGLALIRTLAPDLVITDILMPELGGIAMLEAALAEGCAFKSVILTSHADFSYARQAMRVQAADYLLKPVDEDELARTVARIRREVEETGNAVPREADETDTAPQLEVCLSAARGDNPYVARALEKIRDHYAERLGVESVAEELAVSASYLSRKFKEATRQTFLEFLMRYRIQKAVALLREGTYRVYEVSERTGFGDYKHFCTVFKKYTRSSPKQFLRTAGGAVRRADAGRESSAVLKDGGDMGEIVP